MHMIVQAVNLQASLIVNVRVLVLRRGVKLFVVQKLDIFHRFTRIRLANHIMTLPLHHA